MIAKALYHQDCNSSIVQSVQLKTDENALLIRALFSMISTGTEIKVAKGEISANFSKQMSVPYMEGDFDLPIKYGYALVGEVQTEGELQGKKVQLLHPHQDYCLVDFEDVSVIPNNISALRASLASNMETVVNAIWDSDITIGQSALIVGFGNVGGLLAETLRTYFNCKVYIAEKNDWRLQKANELDFEIHKEQSVEVAFHTSATSIGLQYAIEQVEKEGKVIELSWYGNRSITLQLGKSFHYNRKQIISSQVSCIPKHKQDEWTFAKRKQYVFELLKADVYDVYITKLIPFEKNQNKSMYTVKIREHIMIN